MSDPDDPDMLAAEYVLGTLDVAERGRVAARIGADPAFASAVEGWQLRLSPLSEATAAVAPPEGAFAAISARLFGRDRPRDAGGVVPLRPAGASMRDLRRWQAAAAACAALAATLLAWIAVAGAPGTPTSQRLVAVLQRDPGAPTMVLDVDLPGRRLTVRAVSAAAPAGKAYELWIIAPALGPPRSLGVVPARAEGVESLAGIDAAVISGATYAVTIEPPGGSPDGKPSGTPVLVGKLVAGPT